MSGLGLRVPRSRGEETRRKLTEAGLLAATHRFVHDGEFLVLPLVSGARVPPDWGEVVQREFERVSPAGPADYRELLDWDAEEKAKLPRSFDVVGDIVLIRIPPEVEPRRQEIGEALLAFVPSARLVGADRGVRGPERRRELERIAGAGPWTTRHRENGLELEVDLERAYFSPRLAHEHERVAADVRKDERVYDLCCGIGPFSVAIARDGRARRVTAVDANPAAIALLRATLGRYPFGPRVEPLEARLEEFLPTAEPRERVILNLPLEGIKYLPSVARTVAPTGRLHYYEVVPRASLDVRTEGLMEALGTPGTWSVIERHPVHPYSPASDLVAFVLERAGA